MSEVKEAIEAAVTESPTPEEIAAKAAGAVLMIEVEDPKTGEKRVGYFRKPERNVIGLAYAKLQKNRVEAVEFLLKNCIIGKLSTVNIDDDADFFALLNEAEELLYLIEQKKSKSKKL
jgi:hypothetical protein